MDVPVPLGLHWDLEEFQGPLQRAPKTRFLGLVGIWSPESGWYHEGVCSWATEESTRKEYLLRGGWRENVGLSQAGRCSPAVGGLELNANLRHCPFSQAEEVSRGWKMPWLGPPESE